MAKTDTIEDILNMIMDGNSSDIEQLGEDEDEEWTPARIEEHPDSGDDEEEENPDKDDDDEAPEIPKDKTPKQSGKSKVKRKEYRWEKIQFEAPSAEFVEPVEEDSEERLDWTPCQYFKDFVTEDMLQEIAEETNLYSVQKNGKSVNTNAQEIEQLLGMYMHMGLVQMPNVRAYWETETRYPPVLIHFQNNLNVSEDAKQDKVWKLRPWLEKLRQRFLCIPPEECHAVDEIMVPFKGKSHQRCYMPGKPHKWGFKMWGRGGQSGYMSLMCAKGDEILAKRNLMLVLQEMLITKFLLTISLRQFHWNLKQRGIYYIGTVRMNRVKDCQLMDEKELKKKGRGSLDFRVNQENNIIVRWYDNKAVNLLSSFVGVEPLCEAPAIVDTYNRFMGGIDLLDMLSALYKFSFRSQRWYIYIWWHTITVAVINACIRYRRDLEKLHPRQKHLPLRRFQASVATTFVLATPTPPRRRKTTELPPDVRKDGLNHFPTWETQQRCKPCVGHFAHVFCEKCRVHLCLNKDINCFQAYHNAK
uniref:PiggyBac transposable element-derived protein domain-containing protein n=1 Tax=Poecilia mexicana TaxID=48701 RepID=A0A3B3WBV0_9TELE